MLSLMLRFTERIIQYNIAFKYYILGVEVLKQVAELKNVIKFVCM